MVPSMEVLFDRIRLFCCLILSESCLCQKVGGRETIKRARKARTLIQHKISRTHKKRSVDISCFSRQNEQVFQRRAPTR
jgi:hypothetical protein